MLAAQGVRCTDGYAAFPVCSPSRAAILTGRYPHRFGPTFEDYFGAGAPDLDPQQHPTIARMLQQAGYATGCFGKWNVSNNSRRPANDYGFDKWIGLHRNHDYFTHKLVATGEPDLFEDGKPFDRNGIWSDTIFADEAIRFIAGNKAKPLFVYLAFQSPHDPIQDPDLPFDPPRDKKKPENRPTYVKMVEQNNKPDTLYDFSRCSITLPVGPAPAYPTGVVQAIRGVRFPLFAKPGPPAPAWRAGGGLGDRRTLPCAGPRTAALGAPADRQRLPWCELDPHRGRDRARPGAADRGRRVPAANRGREVHPQLRGLRQICANRPDPGLSGRALSPGLPINRSVGLKFAYLGSRTLERIGADSDTFAVAVSVMW
jgi:hypothetical protein